MRSRALIGAAHRRGSCPRVHDADDHRARAPRHHAGAVSDAGVAAGRSEVRCAAGREGLLRFVRRRPLQDRDPRQLERRARALRARLRVQRRRAGIGASGRQLSDSRTPDQGRLRVGRVELPVQRLRAGAGAARHDGAHRALYEIQRGTRAAACLSHRHVDGRSRDAARHARIPDRLRRRPGDVPRRPGAVRLLRRHRSRGGSHHRRAGEARDDAGRRREDERAARQARRLHGQRTAARQRGDSDQRRTASLRDGRAGLRRPVRRQYQPGGAGRQHDAFQPGGDDHADQVRHRRAARADGRRVEQGRAAQGAGRRRSATRWGPTTSSCRSTASWSGRP